ncbi:hypothetical protein FW778_14415 [Ginsengibacter hankyongi]|uniref:Uncharacterized protein n=1 Tax=Ginsengibacter hankyongi TaxID=2607284 RepID=A0A5J5IGE2_9BACT|nr:hypothetical protein [Ginsengibacter hankyongi]KAA9038734.1 hypothetical protein FW778_14415 [Ginsengibacter hankyongi]
MTLYEFNALDEMEQAEAVWDSVFIADREDSEHNILLYQRDAFYIEVYYHKEYNVIRRFRSFSSTEQLNPYLEKMKLKNKF